MSVCDDEAMLVVAKVGADPYHSSSHGFCQMELLVAISEAQHRKLKKEARQAYDGGLLWF